MSDLGFERLPPTVLKPTPATDSGQTTAGAIEGVADKPSVQSTWYGTLVSGVGSDGFVVHLFAEVDHFALICGSNINPAPATGDTVLVGFFSDFSVAITGVVS